MRVGSDALVAGWFRYPKQMIRNEVDDAVVTEVLVTLYVAGASIKGLASTFSMDRGTVRRRLAANQVTLRSELEAKQLANARTRRHQSERFWRLVDTSGECWIWLGSKTKQGYGTFDGTTAHRVAFALEGGVIPEKFDVDHLCAVRDCVRPEHLQTVSHSENCRRRDQRGKRSTAASRAIRL